MHLTLILSELVLGYRFKTNSAFTLMLNWYQPIKLDAMALITGQISAF